MKCSICGKDLKKGQAIVKYEGLEMDSPVTVAARSFSGGVVHVSCIGRLPRMIIQDRASGAAMKRMCGMHCG